MEKKTIFLTGATDGIGKATAENLAKMGHELILHGRNSDKLNAMISELKSTFPDGVFHAEVADFSSLDSVREMTSRMSEKYESLDVILNNAGIFAKSRQLTKDGYESTFGVNHLAPFLLTMNLLDKLPEHGRVVVVSSVAHVRAKFDLENLNAEKNFDGYGAYALSKLANVLFAFELAERVPHLFVNALHPGVVSTKLLKTGFGMRGPDSHDEGSETSVFLATVPDLKTTGAYFDRKKVASHSPVADDAGIRKKFFELSSEMVGLT